MKNRKYDKERMDVFLSDYYKGKKNNRNIRVPFGYWKWSEVARKAWIRNQFPENEMTMAYPAQLANDWPQHLSYKVS